MAGQLATNYDTSKIFLGGLRTITATYTNGSGSTVTPVPGWVFGRVTADNKVKPCDKDNTDGSQFPRFILVSDPGAITNGSSATLTLAYRGEVDSSLLVFASGESLTSVVATTYTDSGADAVAVSFGTMHDLLIANGFELVSGTELSNTDNA